MDLPSTVCVLGSERIVKIRIGMNTYVIWSKGVVDLFDHMVPVTRHKHRLGSNFTHFCHYLK